MVDTTTELQSKLDEFNRLNESQVEQGGEEQLTKKDVMLFFSFDIVNSTAYKTVNYYGWAQVLNLVFKKLREKVNQKINSAELWRILGDEAIFIVKIREENDLGEYVKIIFKIMLEIIEELKKGNFFKSDDRNLMKLQNILSLKAAAWIAVVNNVGNIEDDKISLQEGDNIFEKYQSQDGNSIFEFLGNDIDTGFRVASQTQEGRLALSYELAYLISQKTQDASYLYIITYKRLKGVWKDKLYPVIWYHNPNAYEKLTKFEDSFTFDACDKNELVKEYYDNRFGERNNSIIRDKRMYIDSFYAFNKILKDRGLENKIERLQQIIKETRYSQVKYMDEERMQIHCAAVCFKKENSGIAKILIAKRKNTREKFKGVWEFGCAKASINKDFATQIKEEYKQDFNIDIEPIMDETREMKEPIPIALYHIERNEGKQDKGIIVLAEIVGDYNIESFKETEKHSELKWVIENEILPMEALESAVPDFKRTLEEAFKRIQNLK